MTAEDRGQTSEEKNDEARMTNDEGMTKDKWSSLALARAHNPNRGTEYRSDLRSLKADVRSEK